MTPPMLAADQPGVPTDAEFIALIPSLRAFAYSLARSHLAEDLAQEAMAKAWKSRTSYRPGTSLKAWIFTILRNQFYSDQRRSWRTRPLDPEVAENALVARDDPFASEELLDVRNAMLQLSDEQREALVLVGVTQLPYEEAARICGCAIGTIKSRVNRARVALAGILERSESGRRVRTEVSSLDVFEDVVATAAKTRDRLASART